ncbi:hypothetical protein HY250_03365 [Candidatus Azambacteria bacterium]|nr:hypothetical protein [Candidatus Azambacteria bacterium]
MISNNFWYAVATLTGTIIGVGMFGLPFVASRAGFFILCAYLAVFAAIFVALHLMFGEIILRTKERHRMTGYAGIYLGAGAKRFFALTALVGLSGGMLVYILVGGAFFQEATYGIFGSVYANQFIFWAIMSAVLALGLRMVKELELAMFALMIGIIVFLFFMSVPHLDAHNLAGFDPSKIFLPYGVVLFALAGGAAIPAMRDMLEGKEHAMKRAIITGTLIPVCLYALFTIAILGVSGAATSENALSGLHGALGESAVFLGAVLGVALVATSYLVFGLYLRDTLRYDMGISDKMALACALLVPFVLLFFQWRSFIEIIGFLGALLGGIDGIFLIMIYRRARKQGNRQPEYTLCISNMALYALMCIFAAGIAYITLFDGTI